MARLLFRESWFDEVATSSIYEIEFERIILSKADVLFPDFHVIPFKPIICSDEETARPDLVLVDKSYSDLWIVEVEMAHHSFESHVLPQIRTLSRGHYGEETVNELCTSFPGLNRNRVLDMLKGRQPRVLIIVNAVKEDWADQIEAYGARIAFLQVFRSDRNEHILVADGTWPTGRPESSTECFLDTFLPRLLVVGTPSVLGLVHGQRTVVSFENCATEWERLDTQDKVWLAPIGLNPLRPGMNYQLARRRDGSLVLSQIGKH